MAVINWDADPVVGDAYADVLADLRERDDHLIRMDSAGDGNIPTGAMRYNATTDRLEVYDGSLWDDALAMERNYIAGLITSRDGGDPTNDINITAGDARDATNAVNIRLATEITKQIDAIWSVGDDAGGIDAGAVAADTLYAIWLIKRSDTGVVDALFSTSFTAPTMPANYDFKRLIAAVMTDGVPAIIDYTQSDNYFRYTGDVVQDLADATITSDAVESTTLSVPPNCLAHIYGTLENPTTTSKVTGILMIRPKGAADLVTEVAESFATVQVDALFDTIAGEGMVLVDVDSAVEYAANEVDGIATVSIRTIGFTMLTRREP